MLTAAAATVVSAAMAAEVAAAATATTVAAVAMAAAVAWQISDLPSQVRGAHVMLHCTRLN